MRQSLIGQFELQHRFVSHASSFYKYFNSFLGLSLAIVYFQVLNPKLFFFFFFLHWSHSFDALRRTIAFIHPSLTPPQQQLRKFLFFPCCFIVPYFLISSHRSYVWELSEQNLSFHFSLVGEGISGSSEATSESSSSIYLDLGRGLPVRI